ncbi:MAG: hypothetical protein K2Q26_12590 [Bdellovibrionales bacterium]|nr:hypothetical protein [Bdellovibrionales bacterium]
MIKFCIFFALIFPSLAFAKDVFFGSGTAKVPIKWEMIDPLNPKLGLRPTYLRFPKPVYRFDNVTLFSVEAAKGQNGQADFRELKIYPRKTAGNQQVEIVLQDRAVIRVHLTISIDDGVPLSYDFRPEKIPSLDSSNDEKAISELDVMKMILSGKTPFGMKEKKMDSRLNCKGRGLSARVLRSIAGMGYNVFQVKISNSSQDSFKIQPHRIYFSGRDLAKSELKHVESETLSGKESIILTILGDQSASIWNASLCDLGSQLVVFEKAKKR